MGYSRTAIQPVSLMQFIARLDEIAPRYGAILCDVWGVLHNGEWSFPEAAGALERARANGIAVVLVTNAPRRSDRIIEQLGTFGVPRTAYDRVVTSGDATRDMIAGGPRRIFHIGTERELTLYEELDVELCEEREADVAVCTGLFNDEVETPADYQDLLGRLRSRDVPMICANPDIVVERGTRLIFCAGAIAREYQQLGGRVSLAGKPHSPIYALARREIADMLGHPVEASKILAIGDGLLTDVKGAVQSGFDVLYISAGIHALEYGQHGKPERDALTAWLGRNQVKPVATMPMLA